MRKKQELLAKIKGEMIMKTVSCDICGRTLEQMASSKSLLHCAVYEFKAKFFGKGRKIRVTKTIYICPDCLFEIEKLMRAKEDEDE